MGFRVFKGHNCFRYSKLQVRSCGLSLSARFGYHIHRTLSAPVTLETLSSKSSQQLYDSKAQTRNFKTLVPKRSTSKNQVY